MTASFIPYGRQQIDDDDVRAVVEALKSDWLTTGPAVDRFERLLAGAVGAAGWAQAPRLNAASSAKTRTRDMQATPVWSDRAFSHIVYPEA